MRAASRSNVDGRGRCGRFIRSRPFPTNAVNTILALSCKLLLYGGSWAGEKRDRSCGPAVQPAWSASLVVSLSLCFVLPPTNPTATSRALTETTPNRKRVEGSYYSSHCL